MRGGLAAALAVAGLVAGVGTGAAVTALSPSPAQSPVQSPALAQAAQPTQPAPATDGVRRLLERGSRTEDRAVLDEGAAVDPVDEVVPVDEIDDELAALAAQVLPEGIDEIGFAAGLLSTVVPDAGTGHVDVVAGEVPAPGTGTVVSVRIEVEQGLDIDHEKFAQTVLATLNDPRSWGGDGSRTFSRTAGEATLAVTLASPTTVDRLCAPLDTGGLWSCGMQGRAVLNHLRWVTGSGVYGDDMAAYRQYLVNHEVGHVLGHRHARCASSTSLAPVMVQQSGAPIACLANQWPFP